jgi:hypothetical protein
MKALICCFDLITTISFTSQCQEASGPQKRPNLASVARAPATLAKNSTKKFAAGGSSPNRLRLDKEVSTSRGCMSR